LWAFYHFGARWDAFWRPITNFRPDDFVVKQSFLNHAIQRRRAGSQAGGPKMSNIANQLVAVVATLLGFVAHDALTQRSTPVTVVASATEATIDPVVTRALNLDGISSDWLNETARAERAAQPRPLMRVSAAAVAPRLDPHHVDAEFADIRINHARVAAPGVRNDAFIR
jgi:hypothetical protein